MGPLNTVAAVAVRPLLRSRTEQMRCPKCADMQEVTQGSVSHRCTACRAVFWWALCGGCSGLQRVPDSVESWHCGCGSWNRSWWRTPDRDAAAASVASRRAEGSRLLPRPSRATVFAFLAAFFVAGALSIQFGGASSSDAADSAAPACAAFRDYRSRITAGASPSADAVVHAAQSAPNDVREAARRLADTRASGDPDAQLAAISAMAALCPAV